MKFLKHFSLRKTPQSLPILGSSQVPNSAGGFSFALGKWQRLERFLVLGTDGGSYYATERALTLENAECVCACLSSDAMRTVQTIVAISDSGRAPRNEPAIFALAMAAGLGHTALAMDALPKVCRTGTHLFQFAQAVEQFRGWGRGLRKGVAAWYTARTADDLAYQVVKYQQRNGWSHRDLLRLAHVQTDSPAHQAVLRWAVSGIEGLGERSVRRGKNREAALATYPAVADDLPRIIQATDEARKASHPATVARLIREEGLPRECVPTHHLNDARVWDALLESMPMAAMVRNLAKMTAVGLLTPMSQQARRVANRLADADALRRSRLHPMAILLAARTYARGHGLRGSLKWEPVSRINDALDAAFYKAFASVQPAGKRTLIGLDVSASMAVGMVAGAPLTPREAGAALAMVTARTEPEYQLMAFGSKFMPLDISTCSRLADVLARTAGLPFSGTDCALPMLYALEHRLNVETFIVLTDSETWFGKMHPVQALKQYRRQTGIPAKLIVVGMVSNGFTIADPDDAGMLDVVGFDAAAPALMADFSRS